MNILALQPYGDAAGHYGKYTVRILSQLAAQGHQVTLGINTAAALSHLEGPPAFAVEALGPGYAFFDYEKLRPTQPLRWLWGRIRNNLATLRLGARLAAQQRFDVAQLFSYELISTWLFFALRPRARLFPAALEIAAPNFDPSKHYGSRLERMWRRWQKLAVRRLLRGPVCGVGVNSASHVAELRRQLSLPEDFPVELVADTREVPPGQPDKSAARGRVGLNGYSGCVFLLFGTLRRDKGVETLLEALERLPGREFRLLVAGLPLDWNGREGCRDPRLVTRFEYIPEEETPDYFFAADALLLPYASFYAGSSGPLYDACAHRLPVIVSDVSEMGPLARRHELGLVVPPGDPGALAQAMEEFVRLEPAQRERLGRNALALVEGQTRRHIAHHFTALYEKVVAEGRRRRPPAPGVRQPRPAHHAPGS